MSRSSGRSYDFMAGAVGVFQTVQKGDVMAEAEDLAVDHFQQAPKPTGPERRRFRRDHGRQPQENDAPGSLRIPLVAGYAKCNVRVEPY